MGRRRSEDCTRLAAYPFVYVSSKARAPQRDTVCPVSVRLLSAAKSTVTRAFRKDKYLSPPMVFDVTLLLFRYSPLSAVLRQLNLSIRLDAFRLRLFLSRLLFDLS